MVKTTGVPLSMKHAPLHGLWALAIALLLELAAVQPASAQAVAIGPARYFRCQLAAREATIVGVQERALLLSRQAAQAELNAAGERSRLRVEMAFTNCGYRSDELAAYAQQNAEVVNTWLATHPEIQARMAELRARMQAVSERIPAAQKNLPAAPRAGSSKPQ